MNKLFQEYKFLILGEHNVDVRAIQDINLLLGQLTSRSNARIKINSIHFDGSMQIIIAKHGSAIVGMGVVCKVPRLTCTECEIHDVVVDKKHRGKGIAGEILGRLMDQARSRYLADHVNLTSRPDREEANRLYLNHGFQLRETNCYRFTFDRTR